MDDSSCSLGLYKRKEEFMFLCFNLLTKMIKLSVLCSYH